MFDRIWFSKERPMTKFRKLLITCALLFVVSVAPAGDENSVTGTVAETMTSGGYVYVRLEENETWLASTPVPLAVGDKVRYAGSAAMKDFTSRTLNRTFDSILFVSKLEVVNGLSAEAHAAVAASNQYGISKSATTTTPEDGEIKPLEGGKSIVDIYSEAQQLRDKQVKLRARVMKVSKNILGKNWITLQDGTGTAPDNKLIATSAELVEIGALVTAKGVIKTDVDIGSGYKYKVIMEEATFSE